MEKSFEMDFEEWVLLPDTRHSFNDFGIRSEKRLVFDINYFSCDKNSKSPLIEEKEECKDIEIVPPPPPPPEMPMIIADHHDLAPIFLFKLKDDEKFIDMKIESPKISMKGSIMPPVEPEHMLFDSEEEEEEEFYKDEKNSEKEIDYVETEIKDKQNCRPGFGLKVWGVGALCSFGVAAATLCVCMLGGQQLQKHQNQKIQFQIYTDEKRIEQVMQQATRLNHAFSATRGVTTIRAHISFGGYYDGL